MKNKNNRQHGGPIEAASTETPVVETLEQVGTTVVDQTPADVPAPTAEAPVAEAPAAEEPEDLGFNPVTVDVVDNIPGLEDSGLTGNCLALRINPKQFIDIDTPEKLYEHARAAWSGPIPENIQHVIVFQRESVKFDAVGAPGAPNHIPASIESKATVLAVYDVETFEAFNEASLVNFKLRSRSSFCQQDKLTKKPTEDLLVKRWMFTGKLNEKATTSLRGLFWAHHVAMFWKIKQGSASELLENVSVLPPEKVKSEKVAPKLRSFSR